MEDIKLAKVQCALDIISLQEQVLPLSDNKLMIYSTQAQEVSLKCLYIPNIVKRIPGGVTTQESPISCAMNLENATFYLAFSQLLHYPWKDTTVKEPDIDDEDIEETRLSLPRSRHDKIHISEIVKPKTLLQEQTFRNHCRLCHLDLLPRYHRQNTCQLP